MRATFCARQETSELINRLIGNLYRVERNLYRFLLDVRRFLSLLVFVLRVLSVDLSDRDRAIIRSFVDVATYAMNRSAFGDHIDLRYSDKYDLLIYSR